MIKFTAQPIGGTSPITYVWQYDENIFSLISLTNSDTVLELGIKEEFNNLSIDTTITVTGTDANGCVFSKSYNYMREVATCETEVVSISSQKTANETILYTANVLNPNFKTLTYSWNLVSQYGTIVNQNNNTLEVQYTFPSNTSYEGQDSVSVLAIDSDNTSCIASKACKVNYDWDYPQSKNLSLAPNIFINCTNVSSGINGNITLQPGTITVGSTVQISGASCQDGSSVSYYYSTRNMGQYPNPTYLTPYTGQTFNSIGTYYIYAKCEVNGVTYWEGPEVLTVSLNTTITACPIAHNICLTEASHSLNNAYIDFEDNTVVLSDFVLLENESTVSVRWQQNYYVEIIYLSDPTTNFLNTIKQADGSYSISLPGNDSIGINAAEVRFKMVYQNTNTGAKCINEFTLYYGDNIFTGDNSPFCQTSVQNGDSIDVISSFSEVNNPN